MHPRTTPRSILVLCIGNHCRSPIAEALLGRALGPDFRVSSAGLAAMTGVPAHPEARRLMAERGLDLSAHRGRPLTPEAAAAADLILVMDREQAAACNGLLPFCRGRVQLFGRWLPPGHQEIADPMGCPPEAFVQAASHIQEAVDTWAARFKGPNPG